MAQIFYMAEVDSTNADLFRRAAEGAPEGTVSVALKQTGGRGRLGRNWFSPEGGIYFSMLFRPEVDATRYNGSPLVTALSAKEAIMDTAGLKVEIHLPNDLYCSGKKIGGVLVETMVGGRSLLTLVVAGIGINVNIKKEDFPADLKKIATSLLIETGKNISPRNFIIPLRERLIENFARLKKQGFQDFLPVLRKSCITLGKKAEVRFYGKSVVGTVLDITSEGAMLFKPEDGLEQKIIAPEKVILL
ncbi:MAG: biotin--[acetyl-CoA-carboxylase] ligase [Candidatus Eremiobacteraeota bacterium]|nr:biotin--[acetyl-CoA-carboxylase] ligase [Candidatus Eremiobacteraeota bacterium]